MPKAPNLDLLLIDLEKLATQANVDLIGVETPGSEDLKASQKEMGELLEDIKGKPQKQKGTAEKASSSCRKACRCRQ